MERYDRQIRLWGESGQASLSSAAVLVVGSTATATETLKNLVLPGIASFTIVDHLTCAEAHPQNFFVPATDSSPAAASAAEHLAELNPSVAASYISAALDTFLDTDNKADAFVSRYSLVIVAQKGMGHPSFRILASAALRVGVPFMQVRSYGFLGYIRMQFPRNSAAVECDKDDEVMPDLRLYSPFPELQQLAHDSMSKLKDPDTANRVPFVLILLLALEQYRKQHDDELPKTRADSNKLVELVKQLRPEGCPEDALNFEEALKSRNLIACRKSSSELPYNVKQLFADARSNPEEISMPPSPTAEASATNGDTLNAGQSLPTPVRISPVDPSAMDSTANGNDTTTNNSINNNNNTRPNDELKGVPAPGSTSTRSPSARVRAAEASFWVLVAAVRAFYEKSGHLPLTGSLPDMAADTESYIVLQRLYAKKAADDAKAVFAHAVEIAERRSSANVPCTDTNSNAHTAPDAKAVADFCKTMRQAHIVRGRSIHAEYDHNINNNNFMNAARDAGALDAANTNATAAYYALLRAVDEFYMEHKRYPDSASDIPVLRQVLAKTKERLGGIPADLWSDQLEEITRAAGAELHNVAALIGGIAAQEAVKIITRQFLPLNNTLIFDTYASNSFSFSA